MKKFRWRTDRESGLTTALSEADARALVQRVLWDGRPLPKSFRIWEVPPYAMVDMPFKEKTLFEE